MLRLQNAAAAAPGAGEVRIRQRAVGVNFIDVYLRRGWVPSMFPVSESAPGVPGGDPVIRLFAAWPDEWDAQFTLRARGGFVVTAAQRSGRVEFVELRSESGSVVKMRNPWGAAARVSLTRNGTRAKMLRGQMLVFDTEPGDVITLRGN